MRSEAHGSGSVCSRMMSAAVSFNVAVSPEGGAISDLSRLYAGRVAIPQSPHSTPARVRGSPSGR